MMNRSRTVAYSIAFIGCIATVAVIITVCLLYNTAFHQTEKHLKDTVESYSNLIEAVTKFDRIHSQDTDFGDAAAATLAQIVDAHEHDSGFGETGEFTLATLEDDSVNFLLSRRHNDDSGAKGRHELLPMSGTLGEPMRLALQGRSGTVVGVDYRGETVVAAYRPVAELDCGIAAKIDLAEIRSPFLKAGACAILVVVLVTWVVGIVVVRPLVSRLAESTARIAAIIETATDPIITISSRGLIESFNPAAERLFGYSESEVLKKNVKLLMPSPYREEHDGHLARYLATGKAGAVGFGREVVGERKDGTTFPVYLSVSQVVIEGQDEAVLFTGIMHDLTAQKQVELELIKAKEAAELANTAKSEFLANMSHEIRTPMTAILGFNDVLLGGVTEPEHLDAARTVKENGDYLINLINDILDLSKIDAGKLDVEQIDCSPHEVLAEVTALMKVRATAKGVPLETRLDGPLPETIHSDPTRLRQVLINVVGNAIKFTEAGSVRFVTRLLNEPGEDARLRIDVTDTGIGIDEEQIERLFSSFTQADSSTTRRFGGTGLGLAISKRLVEILGGTISVASTLGKGSTFSVTVPTGPLDKVRLIHDAVAAFGESTQATVVENTAAPLGSSRILLAEDGSDNQRLIGFILKKAGAEVTCADNGQIAFDLATAATANDDPFDVILMDMQMPVLDGYAATRRLREEGCTWPIIALTAHAMSTDRQKCLDAGCDEYLTKPIDKKSLLATVHAFASKSLEETRHSHD